MRYVLPWPPPPPGIPGSQACPLSSGAPTPSQAGGVGAMWTESVWNSEARSPPHGDRKEEDQSLLEQQADLGHRLRSWGAGRSWSSACWGRLGSDGRVGRMKTSIPRDASRGSPALMGWLGDGVRGGGGVSSRSKEGGSWRRGTLSGLGSAPAAGAAAPLSPGNLAPWLRPVLAPNPLGSRGRAPPGRGYPGPASGASSRPHTRQCGPGPAPGG